ncbi:hypothetical protein CBM2638_U40002 [Cupriavidus taiwanensis]|nr:hypothetical protein CBM2638_U40002 [Cupriavidus taiwanensis]
MRGWQHVKLGARQQRNRRQCRVQHDHNADVDRLHRTDVLRYAPAKRNGSGTAIQWRAVDADSTVRLDWRLRADDHDERRRHLFRRTAAERSQQYAGHAERRESARHQLRRQHQCADLAVQRQLCGRFDHFYADHDTDLERVRWQFVLWHYSANAKRRIVTVLRYSRPTLFRRRGVSGIDSAKGLHDRRLCNDGTIWNSIYLSRLQDRRLGGGQNHRCATAS